MGVGGQCLIPAVLPPGKTRYPLYRRLGGPQSPSGQVRKMSPPPGIDPRNPGSTYGKKHIIPTNTSYGKAQRFFNAKPGRLLLKCDGTRAETRFCFSAKRTSPFKLAGASVQSTTVSRDVRISGSNGSNAGYTVFQRWCEGLPTPFGSFPFTSPPVRHRVPSRFNWTLVHMVAIGIVLVEGVEA